jgi:hypothetical protein
MTDPRLPKFQFPPTDANGESSLPLNAILPDPRLFNAEEGVGIGGAVFFPAQRDGVWGWETGRRWNQLDRTDGDFYPWEPA